jgi:16S rRNA (uracil1498-N3)-methyltransferase
MTLRRFYALRENFKNQTVTLEIEQTRHLRDVLRLHTSEKVRIFDGEGNEFSCEIETIGKKETLLKVIEEVSPTAPESNLDLTLAVALLKGEKFDLVVQKAVELGITKIIPLNTKRADVKFADAEKKLERWRKIIIDATKQCGRAKLTTIGEPLDFEKFLETADGKRILFAERNGESFSQVKTDKKMIAVIGSEGGWEDSEIEAARKNDFQIITLNGRILRAETAAISIAAILQHRCGDLD